MKHERIMPGRVLGYQAFRVLNLITVEVQKIGYVPCYESICAELGIKSKGEVSRIMDSLERRGHIFRVGAGRSRKVVLVKTANLQDPAWGAMLW